jgi:phosphoglycolate phosphatase-like HAD superfamily hydrolase
VKAILFDIDGTLVDSNELHVAAWDEAIQGCGRWIARDSIRGQIGKGADMLLPSLFPDMAPAHREDAANRHGVIFRTRYLAEVKAFPHATDLISLLHARGKKIVLASSAERRELDHYMRLLKIENLVAAATSADDVEASKPAGDIFANALGKVFPIGADEALAIGDTPYDVIAAAKCGIKTIGVRSGGFSETSLKEAGAVAIYSDVQALFEDFDASLLGNR